MEPHLCDAVQMSEIERSVSSTSRAKLRANRPHELRQLFDRQHRERRAGREPRPFSNRSFASL